MYKVHRFSDPKDFYSKHKALVLADPARYSIIAAVTRARLKAPNPQLYCGEVLKGGDLCFIFIISEFYTNYVLVCTHTEDQKAMQALVDFMLVEAPEVNRCMCISDMAEFLQKEYKAKGFDTETLVEQGIYVCHQVKVPEIPQGLSCAVAAPEDKEALAEWGKGFMEEAVPHDPPQDPYDVAEQRIQSGSAFVLKNKGEPVATACWSRDLGDTCAINFVYTPKEHRKKGYGSLVTALVTEAMFKKGKKKVCLYTDMANPTSNKIYKEIGYEWVCPSRLFKVEKEKP